MLKNFRNIAVISLSTIGSRVLGLVRDIMIFAALGTSIWNSAFILAFTLPNLFRRLLGEGALTSAVVPVFTDVLKKQGRQVAFHFFNQVLLRVCAILLATVTGGIVILAVLNSLGVLKGRWMLGADLSVVLLPYMIFICLAAIVSAGLNVIGRFAAAALTPVLLNLSMIGSLAVAWFFGSEHQKVVHLLCGGVLMGGLLQLALPAWDLFRQGWRPKLARDSSESLDQVWALFLPGLMGAAILQVNILVSRLLAFSLDESSVSVLYLASRLMELPLGVFTISVVTVFFPLLASAVSDRDKDGFAISFNQGVRLILAISIPAGVGLLVLAEPILALLFNWGNFNLEDVAATAPLLIIYAVGLPFYSLATFATRGLHACKDMVSPVRVAGFCLVINAVSGYLLMQFFGAAGLAAANIIAAMVQACLLWRGLSRSVAAIRVRYMMKPLLQIGSAAIVMACAVIASILLCQSFIVLENDKIMNAVLVVCGIPAGVISYLTILTLLRFEDIGQLKTLLLRKTKADARVVL
ncbi:murein biosynthesis integral membrane protein MurJ [Coraliomargarita sinensis]|uniref:Probable lipid II flippase MurJ n=1 Tax=Coraliomargarita sinensis TaxID=2174842 RepID=A0A317ZK51_9BACT|nr:murein biosynthesis integral membrane protein MurJ [Coraliomargarita sinensis]PXA04189.1 murein biosynthesis integral membrane protein MurJ [Coraliomargarita sinensis]